LVVVILLFLGAWLIFKLTYTPKDTYTVNLSSQTVIKQIESLNRLETASYTIEKIVDVQTAGSKLQQFLYGDRILLIAHGQVIAGFDLSKVSEKDISVKEDALTVKLPAPEVLVTKLDNEQTQVYDRQKGILTKGDRNLESEARSEAERVIKDAACKGGILDEASKNAKKQLEQLFTGLGFTQVAIEIPKGSCSE
jgi:Protein of unknown function (DUF4230)